jgi:OmpA-OmpF porin, OOP family
MPIKLTPLCRALVLSALLPTLAVAQTAPNQGYWLDSSGHIVTSSTTGLCWHTGEWTPALAVEPCDPVPKRAVAVQPPASTPAAPTPAAPPPVAVAKPAPQKISFSADALFDFDKAMLKPQGKTALDDLARTLAGTDYDTITVTGHADRMGSKTYNQRLSEHRADAVKAYLVGKNVPQNRIVSSGMGEQYPVTQAGECSKGKRAAQIACLQPDRRVDIEMRGMAKPAK